jgi:hypothetical protein
MTRLDDLLAYDDSDGRRRQRPSRSGLGVALPLIAIGSIGIWWLLHRFGIGTPYLLIVASLLAIYGLRYILGTIGAPTLPRTLRDQPPRSPERPADEDGVRLATRTWDQRLDYAQDDARHLTHLIQPSFRDVVDERLRLVHGISRSSDPDRARALIGPQLWKFLTEPVPRRVTPQEIAALVAQMEAL